MPDNQIKKLSFEYILLKMIEWYFEVNDVKTIEEFNKINSFSREKVLLLPFFVFAANGHRKDLLEVLDNFHADEIGIVDTDIVNYLDTDLFKINEFKTEFKTANIESIEKFKIILKNKEYFDEINNIKSIFDCSIKTLREKNNIFINSNILTLKFNSQRHNSWQIFYNGKSYKIPENILIKEKSIFSNQPETITYV